MITDYRLLVFKWVAQLLSFTKASGELSISQPAVSKHISELEKQLGVALFERNGSKIMLTENGEKLLELANPILLGYDKLNEFFLDHISPYKGVISVGASPTVSQYILPSILAKFKKAYPGIQISLHNGSSDQIEQMIEDGAVSFGVVEGNFNNPALSYEPFINDQIVLVTSDYNDKPIDKTIEITINELKTIPIVIRETGSGTLEVIQQALTAKGISFNSMNIQMKLGSTESIKRYVEFSETYAFISVGAIKNELRDGRLRIIDIKDLEIKRTFRFASINGDYSRLFELFKNFCLLQYSKKL